MNQMTDHSDEKVTREEWRRAHVHGYARIWDGRRYMLRIDRRTGATVWRPVEMTMVMRAESRVNSRTS